MASSWSARFCELLNGQELQKAQEILNHDYERSSCLFSDEFLNKPVKLAKFCAL
jgi:hypothetical protein